ncbi:MAG: ABC transporter permease [Terracidiphilus sp.]
MKLFGLRGFLVRLHSWCRGFIHRGRLESEMEAELANHLEARAADLIRGGCTPEEAARRARIELGPVLMHKEEMRASVGLRWIDELIGDLRYGVRRLRRSPGFSAVAVGSLALGIGANTAIFTVAQHMLLDRLDVPHPEQLRMFYLNDAHGGVIDELWGWWDDHPSGGRITTSFTYPLYAELRSHNKSLADVMAFKPYGRMTVSIRGEAEEAEAEMVSGNYYSVLGVRPQLGRGIQESDDGEVGSGPVVVISDRLWTNRFGRATDVVGKSLLVNATPMTVVGVNPPGFTGAYSAQGTPDIILPFSMQPVVVPQELGSEKVPSLLQSKSLWWVLVMGRSKPGVSTAKAEAELNVVLNAAVRATMPLKKDGVPPQLLLKDGSRGQNPNTDDLEKPVYVLMALSGLVLLLACTNLANLLLARMGARQREMSVRLALGAGRWRILRQSMTESLLLSLMGGAAGLLLAWAVRNVLPRMLADSWAPPAFAAKFSSPIFLFAAAVSIATGFVFGLGPAWQATRVQVGSSLKDSGHTLTRRRRGLGGKAVVAFQVALSMVLVTGAGLFVRTLTRLEGSAMGIRSHNLLLFSVELPETRFPKTASTPILERLEERIATVPGAQSVTLTREPLFSGSAVNQTFISEGTQRKAKGNPSVLANRVGREFFSTFGISVLAGRGFDGSDTRASLKVAVVNESLAKKYFANTNPIGKTFEEGRFQPVAITIVGVCADAKYFRVRADAEPTYYTPYWQKDDGVHEATFAIRTSLAGEALLPSLRTAVRQIDPNLPLLDVRTQDEQIAANLRQERIFAILMSGFGVLALVLACVGIYGIMACAVAQRTSEIGVRLALGAKPRQVLGMILGEATWLSVVGIAIGFVAVLLLARVVRSMLYGVAADDPLTFCGAILVLMLVALGAGLIPARRAAMVQPMEALRHE